MFKPPARARGAPFPLLDIQVPEAALRERLVNRDHRDEAEASDAGLGILECQLEHHSPLDAQECPAAMAFDNSGPLATELLSARLTEWIAGHRSAA